MKSGDASKNGRANEVAEESKGKWFSLKDAARHIGVSIRALEGYVRRGQVPFYKPFGRILFDISELESIIFASRIGGFKCR